MTHLTAVPPTGTDLWAFTSPLATLDQCRREGTRFLGEIDLRVSEAPCQSYERGVDTGKPQSKPPSLDADRSTRKGEQHELPLSIKWRSRMQGSWDDARHLRTDVVGCSAELARELGQMQAWKEARAVDGVRFSTNSDYDSSIQRIVVAWRGWRPDDAAAVESAIAARCAPLAIMKTREAAGYRRDNGEPLPIKAALQAAVQEMLATGRAPVLVAHDLGIPLATVERVEAGDPEVREAKVLELRQRGMSLGRIAQELDMPKSSVADIARTARRDDGKMAA